jgi:hypothetical protein
VPRKAKWQREWEEKPADFDTSHGPRRYIFDYSWHHPRWVRYYEKYDPWPCAKGHRRVWAADGSRARCPTCDRLRQRKKRIMANMNAAIRAQGGAEADILLGSPIIDMMARSLSGELAELSEVASLHGK